MVVFGLLTKKNLVLFGHSIIGLLPYLKIVTSNTRSYLKNLHINGWIDLNPMQSIFNSYFIGTWSLFMFSGVSKFVFCSLLSKKHFNLRADEYDIN